MISLWRQSKTMTDIKLVQFLTGDLLIGQIVGGGLLKTKILNPLRIIVMPNQNPNNKNPSIAFAPWCDFSEDKEFEFDNSHIICVMKPIQQFINQYQMTNSNVIMPTGPKLVLPNNP